MSGVFQLLHAVDQLANHAGENSQIADLKTTRFYTQVSIRHLKQNHLATHPAQLRKRDGEAKPDEAAREEVRSVLAAGQYEDEEEAP